MIHGIHSRSVVLCALLVYAPPGAAQLWEDALPDFGIDLSRYMISEDDVAPFTFRVPVRMEQLHRDVIEVVLHCAVSAPRDDGVSVVIAQGRENVPFDAATGSFRGTLTVRAWLHEREAGWPGAEGATTWQCGFQLRNIDNLWRAPGRSENVPVWARSLEPSRTFIYEPLSTATANQ